LGNVYLYKIGIHIQCVRLGSQQVFSTSLPHVPKPLRETFCHSSFNNSQLSSDILLLHSYDECRLFDGGHPQIESASAEPSPIFDGRRAAEKFNGAPPIPRWSI